MTDARNEIEVHAPLRRVAVAVLTGIVCFVITAVDQSFAVAGGVFALESL